MRDLLLPRLGDLAAIAGIAAIVRPAVALVPFAIERVRGIVSPTTAARRSLRTDLGYLCLSPVTEAFSRALTTLGTGACALAAGHRLGPDLLHGFGPVVEQPRWLIVVEMLFLGDLLYYWTHRLAHTLPWLWRLHAVHHSTRHLRWTSALRAHPAEAYVQLVQVVPLFALGFPVDALAPLLPVFTLYGLVIHADLDVSLRPVSYLVNSPAYHRWHHACAAGHASTNFAGLFPLYDAIFGTYRLPGHAPSRLGIEDADMPETCLGQLAYPFRRRPRARRVMSWARWRQCSNGPRSLLAIGRPEP